MKTLDPVLYQIRKEAILQQARHLFATKGFAETSMDDIARSNHIQKPSLYHYFKSKHQILQEMINLEGERWVTQLREVVSGMDFQQELVQLGMAFLKTMEDPARREFFQIIQFESHKNPEIFKAFKQSPIYRRGPIFELFTKHLKNQLSHTKIAMGVTQFVGSLLHYARLSRLHGENMCLEKFSDSEYIGQLAQIFTRGINGV